MPLLTVRSQRMMSVHVKGAKSTRGCCGTGRIGIGRRFQHGPIERVVYLHTNRTKLGRFRTSLSVYNCELMALDEISAVIIGGITSSSNSSRRYPAGTIGAGG